MAKLAKKAHCAKTSRTQREERRRLPPEKLYEILLGIYPRYEVDALYTLILGEKPPIMGERAQEESEK